MTNATVRNVWFESTGDDTFAVWAGDKDLTDVTWEAGVAVNDTTLRDAVDALAKHSFPKFEDWTALKNAWKRWQTTLEMAYLYHFRAKYVDDRVISPITLMIKPV